MSLTPTPRTVSIADGKRLTIRPAENEDLAAVLQLLAEMHGESPPSSVPTDLQSLFETISSATNRVMLVGVVDEAVLACLDLIAVENLSRKGQPWAMVENVVVEPGWRKKGIGREILERAVEVAREAGCYKVQLVSHEKREAAHALYQRCGFTAPVAGYRRYLWD